MIRRSTWVILVIFVILLVVFIWFGRSDQAEGTPTPTTPIQSLFDFEESEILGLVITKTGNNGLVLIRDNEAGWMIEGVQDEVLDQDKIDSSLSQFLSSRLITTLESLPPLADIGLDPTAYTIEIELVNSEHISLLIGEMTAIGDGYYAQKEDGEVVVINQFPLDTLLEFLETPPVMPTSTPAGEIEP